MVGKIGLAFAASLALAPLGLATSAHAVNLVTNGSFTDTTFTHNSQFGPSYGGQQVTGWTGLGNSGGVEHLEFYYFGGTQTTENAVNQYNDPGGYFHPSFTSLSPDGGAFVGLDGGGPSYTGVIYQDITGLTVGKGYNLSFYWAASQLINRTGPTTEQLQVDFGPQTFSTEVIDNPSAGFSGWRQVNMHFTASSVTQTLRFMSVGSPTGLPPIAALDGVSLTAVPEPATWALMILGLGGVGVAARRRRTQAAA